MKMSRFIGATVVAMASVAFAAQHKHHHGAATQPTTQEAVKPYPLDTCIVSDEKLGGDMGDPIVINYNGQEIKFCCDHCPPKFKKNPEKYLKKLEAAQAKGATTQPSAQ